MPLVKITNPSTEFLNSSEWGDFVARSDKNLVGLGLSIPIFSLTNWDSSTTKPEIAEGSIIEVGGSLYQADADTALTDEGGLIDGTVHIKLVPAGGGASVVPTLTNDVIPAWDAVKAGWYDGTDKFLPFEMDKASAVYTNKIERSYKTRPNELFTKVLDIGVWNMDADSSLSVTHGLQTNAEIRKVTCLVINDLQTHKYDIGQMTTLTGVGSGGVGAIGSTSITLLRTNGGIFDSTSFSSSVINRGVMVIEYEC